MNTPTEQIPPQFSDPASAFEFLVEACRQESLRINAYHFQQGCDVFFVGVRLTANTALEPETHKQKADGLLNALQATFSTLGIKARLKSFAPTEIMLQAESRDDYKAAVALLTALTVNPLTVYRKQIEQTVELGLAAVAAAQITTGRPTAGVQNHVTAAAAAVRNMRGKILAFLPRGMA